ncbi:MAG: hypothetical protein NVS3B12_25750 [Acidimicrobiales bacterium]
MRSVDDEADDANGGVQRPCRHCRPPREPTPVRIRHADQSGTAPRDQHEDHGGTEGSSRGPEMGQRTAHTDDEPRQRKPCGGAPLPQDAPSSDDEDHANEELGGDGQLYAGILSSPATVPLRVAPASAAAPT